MISAVILFVVVPQSTRSFLHNRIGDSTRDVPCLSLGFGGTMCLILLTCSLFLPVSVSHVIVCSYIDTPLEWFDPLPSFYHFLLYICRFLAKIRVHVRVFQTNVTYTCKFLAKICIYMQVFGQKSCTYTIVLYTIISISL